MHMHKHYALVSHKPEVNRCDSGKHADAHGLKNAKLWHAFASDPCWSLVFGFKIREAAVPAVMVVMVVMVYHSSPGHRECHPSTTVCTYGNKLHRSCVSSAGSVRIISCFMLQLITARTEPFNDVERYQTYDVSNCPWYNAPFCISRYPMSFPLSKCFRHGKKGVH